MWLKIDFKEEDIVNWSTNPKNIIVSISDSKIAPVDSDSNSFRLSPIFPLCEEYIIESLDSTSIHFFNFSNAYRVLGRIDRKGTDKLKKCVFFSLGLSSIILITKDNLAFEELRQIINDKENAYEKWVVEKTLIVDIFYAVNVSEKIEEQNISIDDYKSLPVTERAIIDEFCITINLLMPKLNAHMPAELKKIIRLIDEVNKLITELVFLFNSNEGMEIPESLIEYSLDQLKEGKLNQVIRHQNIDRIIQINSALSYISTQAFSGAIPILERRSLIRRNSLLGIGSGILAINNIARFIETSFSKISFDRVLLNSMPLAKPLKGLENLPKYDSSEWHKGSINVFAHEEDFEIPYFKLPYFSGRLGFRETEYSIAAAIQSVSSGASLEWSLLTLTHEMLHGHVRNIIGSLFFGGKEQNPDVLRVDFYTFFDKRINKKIEDESLSDSIRNIILTYCCYTTTHGSLSVKKSYTSNGFKIIVPSQNELWNILEDEFRNISEIFVHVLDLHYFYAGRVSVYIPLIWCSWISVPHINGDVRQYILRSLLAISSKESGGSFSRFYSSVSRLKEILYKHKNNKLNYPIIDEIINILEDEKKLNNNYWPAFKASILIVDLVTQIFVSEKIRASLFNDEFVKWENDEKDEESFEEKFIYNLPEGFNDEVINSPLSFLLDRMIRELDSNIPMVDLERETTLQFLSLNSNK